MAVKVSTGLRNRVLDTGSLKSRLALGFLKIYSGTPPASADDAVTGTLLATISAGGAGTGLSLAASAADGVLTKAAEVWSGAIVATGAASYYRFSAASDTGVSSTTEERIQGTVGLAATDMILTSVSFTTNPSISAMPIDNYVIALPTA